MLGEKIGGISGRITAQRVLSNPGGGPKMETSFQASGSILGVESRIRERIGRLSVLTERSMAKDKA